MMKNVINKLQQGINGVKLGKTAVFAFAVILMLSAVLSGCGTLPYENDTETADRGFLNDLISRVDGTDTYSPLDTDCYDTDTVSDVVADPEETSGPETTLETAEDSGTETEKPADTTKKPADTTKKPSDTTKKPSDTTKRTADTTKSPTVTQKPAGSMVWIPTKGGKKYHKYSDCSNMNGPRHVSVSEAKSLGFTPCKKCY